MCGCVFVGGVYLMLLGVGAVAKRVAGMASTAGINRWLWSVASWSSKMDGGLRLGSGSGNAHTQIYVAGDVVAIAQEY